MLADLIYLDEEEGELEEAIAGKRPVRFNHPATEYSHFTLSDYASAKKILAPVMKEGKVIGGERSLQDIQEYRRKEIESLGKTYRRLLNPHIYKISLSDRLKKIKTDMIRLIKDNY
jgi:nicotinate phosphoribosyltransferase